MTGLYFELFFFIPTMSGAAACVGAAPTADVAAAGVRTTLTPANPEKQDE